MKEKILPLVAICILSFILVFGGCQPKQVTTSEKTAAPTAATTTAAKPPQQQEWDDWVAKARKEGRLAIYTTMGSPERIALSNAARDKFGIEMQLTTGRGSELLARITAERRAGLNIQDLLIGGRTTLQMAKDAGFLSTLSATLILPEVLDPKAWFEDKVPYLDEDRMLLSFFRRPGGLVITNKDMVREDEIKSYLDLLNPKWKGKIAMGDPSLTGAGSFFFSVAYEFMGLSYLTELVKQEPVITRDARLQIEWIARGRYPVAIGISSAPTVEFLEAGAPIRNVILKEGGATNTGNGGLALFEKAPYPYATKVFVNWLLTREGQTLISKAASDQSKRTDVSPEWIDPSRRIQPGLKYIDFESEEMTRVMPERMELAKKMFGHLMK